MINAKEAHRLSPNAREVALAHQIDAEYVRLSETSETLDEAGERCREFFAGKLAAYREELLLPGTHIGAESGEHPHEHALAIGIANAVFSGIDGAYSREWEAMEVHHAIKAGLVRYREGLFTPDIEARYHGESLDEVVARGVELLHLETMDDNCVWIGVDLGGGRRVSITLSCESEEIRATIESDGISDVAIREVRNG